MADLKTLLFITLGVVTVWFCWVWWRMARQGKGILANDPARKNTWYHSIVGFIMCFFDTLGIGNFATTTSAFKFRSSVADEKIPGTLNVGYAIPTIAQAFIYISIVEVNIWTLVLMIAASVMGAWLGAGIIAKWSRRKVQIGMGCALIVAASLMLRAQFMGQADNAGTLALGGTLLALGLAGNFALGALMTLGIGLYAPCLILVSLLGMSPIAAFPIMMGSCAFLMPIGGVRFIKESSYSLPAAIVMTISGIPAVLIAAYIVRSLPLRAVRWLVVIVVVYAAVMMLRSAYMERRIKTARPVEFDLKPDAE
jgi:uncharacterized membrane protein YfcA